MRSVSVRSHILAVFAFLAIFLVTTYGYQISFNAANVLGNLEDASLTRTKREIENLDGDDFMVTGTALEEQQEEQGFWDKVVKIALKLFSTFIEWLNS